MKATKQDIRKTVYIIEMTEEERDEYIACAGRSTKRQRDMVFGDRKMYDTCVGKEDIFIKIWSELRNPGNPDAHPE